MTNKNKRIGKYTYERPEPKTKRPNLRRMEKPMDIQKEVKDLSININEYVQWTGETCASLDSMKHDNIHMLFGMATEVGELMDIFKKNLAYDTEIDWINVREEIGDIMYYLASFCRINGIDLNTVIGVNVAKLMSRYPEKFNKWNANNRNLEKEREILEDKYS